MRLIKYSINKTGQLILIFLGITFLSFCLTYLAPSDPAEIQLNKTGVAPTEELLEKTREEMGLNRPLPVQYADWLKGILSGDMGTSLRNGKPVLDELRKALPVTLILTFFSMLVVTVLSVPLGIVCARFQDSFLDRTVRFITYFLASLPSFFLALLFLYLFSVKLRWFPVIASKNGSKGYIMPVLVLALSLSSWYIRQVRVVVLDELAKGYVAGERARGVPEWQILFRHVLKNCMLPAFDAAGNFFCGNAGRHIHCGKYFFSAGTGKDGHGCDFGERLSGHSGVCGMVCADFSGDQFSDRFVLWMD